MSSTLDRDLNNAVRRQLMQDVAADTRTDLILESALDGSVSLLKKWPDLRSKLHAFLNQPLPELLRPVAWRLYLEDSKRTFHSNLNAVGLISCKPHSILSEVTFEKFIIIATHVHS